MIWISININAVARDTFGEMSLFRIINAIRLFDYKTLYSNCNLYYYLEYNDRVKGQNLATLFILLI